MILLDTNHLSILASPDSRSGRLLLNRLEAIADDTVATTIVSVEEALRGWLSAIHQASQPARQLRPYWQLKEFIDFIADWDVVLMDEFCVAKFEDLRKQRIRIGTQDLKIAAIALTYGATLLTAN